MRRFLLFFPILTFCYIGQSQNLSFTCPRDTILGCNAACFTLKAQFPDIRDLGSDYTVSNVTLQSACRPYVSPSTPGPSTNLSADDTYSNVISIGFNFPFYGINRTDLIVSTNGVICFDLSNASGTFIDYGILDGGGFLSASTGTPENIPSTLYDKALIMGPYHDILPGTVTATESPTQQIKYNTIGSAPNRKWVLSFYKIPLFDCTTQIENTHQIILYESTGIIEVQIFDMEICTTWNDGRAMVGLQDDTRTKAIMAPGRKATDPQWGSIGMNEVWRFIPTGGLPLYRKVELLDASGAVVATGDTTRINANTFETSFANVCPPAGASFFVVKTTYQKLNDATGTIFSLDTVNVTKQAALPVTATMTSSTCGANTGTITATGTGTAPFQYSIDGGPNQAGPLFTNLSSGIHNVKVTDNTGCTNTIPVNVTSISALPSTRTSTNASCASVNNGTITVIPTAGTAPYVFSITGSAVTQPTGAFINLAPGTYTVSFVDANGCTGTALSATIVAGLTITSTIINTVSTSCSGVSDGGTTVTPTSGVGPYTYLVDGLPVASNIITGLSSGSHTITIKDGVGCTGTKTVFISTGSGLNLGTPTITPASCPGVANGTITVASLNGVAPFQYSLDGGTFAPGPVTGVSAAIHTVTVKDATGCTGSVSVAVTNGTGISASAVATAASCGANNGTLVITTTGTAPYSYSIDAGVTYIPLVGNTISGLSAASYSLLIKDANGCKASTIAVVPAAAGIVLTANSATGTTCPGLTNGTITITSNTGIAPYSYSLDGGVTYAPLVANTITGVKSGAITVTIKDANSCTGSVSVTVAAGPALSVLTSSTATTCPGLTNGTISITNAPGVAPYSYSLDGGTTYQPLVANTISGLNTGAFTVTIKDASGCTGTASANVVAGPALTVLTSSTATTCPGLTNGTISITNAPGVAPYNYSLDGGTTYQALIANTINNLNSGAFTVTIKDAAGCTGTKSATVAAGLPLNVSISTTATSCPGLTNGTISITNAPGIPPYNYSLDGGTTYQPLVANTIAGLSSGAYNITIKDATGCTGIKSATVTAGAPLTIITSKTPTTCPGLNDGTISITNTPGVAPYTYSLDAGITYQPLVANTISALSAGVHNITIKDAIGCTGLTSVTIIGGVALTINTTKTGTSCPGVNNGTITITNTPGPSPYSYSTDGGITFLPVTLNTITGFGAGTINLVIKNAIGCTGSVTGTIVMGSGLSGTATPIPTGCPQVNNGSITVTPAAGSNPIKYSIDGGTTWQPSPSFLNLAPGLFTISFQDLLGCSGSASATVLSGSGLTASPPAIVGTSCPGVNNGQITVTPTSGTSPYSYTIDGNVNAGNIFSNLASGNHAISFMDALGCVGNITVSVPAGSNLSATTTPFDPPCANINDGTITINPTTGVPVYSFSIDGGLTWQGPLFTNLAPGPYTIKIRDGIGCTGSTNITLTTRAAITTTLFLTKPLCKGNSNGSIKLTPAGGLPAYQYSIDGGVTFQSGNTFSNLASGSYTIRIRDNAGCIKDTTVTLTEPTLLTASASSNTPATCNGNDGNITVTTNAGGTPAYQYSIDNGITFQPSGSFIVSGGNYNAIKVKDANGCIATASTTVTQIDNMTLTLGPDVSICVGESFTFQPQTNPGTSIFKWTSVNPLVPITSGTIDFDTLKNATVKPTDTFRYVLTAQWGVCPPKKDTISVFVKHKPIVDAGPDQAICFDQTSAILSGQANDLSGTVNYSWSPSADIVTPNAAITVANINETTPYTLTVTDNYGCNFSVSDEITVSLQPPVPAYAGNDTTAILAQPHQLMGSGGVNYSWLPVYPLNLSSAQNPMATLSKDQQFVVTVTDVAGCTGTDTVFVKVYTGPTYYVPSAFSPNGDGLNDIFRPIPVGISYTDWFRVFNRYGEMVYETNKWLRGWDGTYQGKKQPIGSYVWLVKGIDKFGKVVEMKGTVIIVQ